MVFFRLMCVVSLLAFTAGNTALARDAQDVLRTELEQRYPDVQRWEIRELEAKNSTSVTDAPVEIVRIGARSAVRIGRHVQWYAVEGFRKVLETNRTIDARQAVDAGVADVAERNVLASRCEPLTDVSRLRGMRARRALRARDIICADAIEPRPVIARGEPVTVRYLGSRISVSTKGIARTDGNVGDLLTVQNAGSQAQFNAVVSGAGEVTIHE